jgi:hypothetical protein
MASLFAERRAPKVTICRFWVHINFIGGHCVLYRIHARSAPIDASEDCNKTQTPNPAPDGAHVTPLCPVRNSGVEALSEVRRPEIFRAARRSHDQRKFPTSRSRRPAQPLRQLGNIHRNAPSGRPSTDHGGGKRRDFQCSPSCTPPCGSVEYNCA